MALRAIAFYNYGRKEFNRKGWLKHARLDLSASLDDKVFVVTGSNSGIGKELATHLHKRGARVYMFCRNKERAEKAREEILKLNEGRSADNLRLVIADMSLYSDVTRAAQEFSNSETALDGLVCNAGALLDKKVLTSEQVETVFASHFLFGGYFLSKMLLPFLKKAEDPRIVFVTSGGMYNAKVEPLKTLIDGPSKGYNGQLAYAKAKRAQVTLASEWARTVEKVKIVSAHPGWTHTPGVDKAYGKFAQWLLSPLRSLWEGTEGIAWCATTETKNLDNGALYLDGLTQPMHLHHSTEVEDQVVKKFMEDLEQFVETVESKGEVTEASSTLSVTPS